MKDKEKYTATEKINQLDILLKKIKDYVDFYGTDDLMRYKICNLLSNWEKYSFSKKAIEDRVHFINSLLHEPPEEEEKEA